MMTGATVDGAWAMRDLAELTKWLSFRMADCKWHWGVQRARQATASDAEHTPPRVAALLQTSSCAHARPKERAWMAKQGKIGDGYFRRDPEPQRTLHARRRAHSAGTTEH